MNFNQLKQVFSGDHWNINIKGDCNDDSQILFLGDVALAEKVGELIDKNGYQYFFSQLPDTFFSVEIVSFVLECCLSIRGKIWEPKPILMRGQADYLKIFPANMKLGIANVANNHFLDFGEEAALDTLMALKDKGFLYCGATGKDTDQQPLFVETAGGVVAMLAFAPSAHALPKAVAVNVLTGKKAALLSAVAEAKKKAEIVIVQLHQGVEYSPFVDRDSRLLARRIVDEGADCVICHHAHVIQAVEKYRDGIIFHGIGNFLLDVDMQRYPAAAFCLALRMGLCKGEITNISIEPYRLNKRLQVTPLNKEEMNLLGNDICAQSRLIASKIGVLKNDFGAFSILFYSRLKALGEMLKRKGVKETLSYYGNRLWSNFS